MIVEKSLTSAQRDDLRVISGMMIPESDEYKVPGADDAAIQGDIIATLGRDTKMVATALDHIAKLAGQPLAALDEARREAVVTEFVVDADGEVAAHSVYRAMVRNHAQLTYSGVGAWLEDKAAAPPKVAASVDLQAQLKLQDQAASALRDARFRSEMAAG